MKGSTHMNDSDNLKKYQQRLAEINDTSTPLTELSIDDLARDGEALLAAEEKSNKKKSPKTEVKRIPVVNGNNPYVKAREQTLASYPEWKRTEMLLLEKTKKTKDNRHYEEFCRLVTALGDSLSNK
jgi:hypothetical protein